MARNSRAGIPNRDARFYRADSRGVLHTTHCRQPSGPWALAAVALATRQGELEFGQYVVHVAVSSVFKPSAAKYRAPAYRGTSTPPAPVNFYHQYNWPRILFIVVSARSRGVWGVKKEPRNPLLGPHSLRLAGQPPPCWWPHFPACHRSPHAADLPSASRQPAPTFRRRTDSLAASR